MPVHVERVELQAAAIVEGHVAADAVERLASGDNCVGAVGAGAQQALHRTTVEVVRSQIQIRVITRSRWPCCLDGFAAFLVALQIEAVLEVGIDVLEVRIGSDSKPPVVASGRLGDVGTAGIRVLTYSTGVLVNECDGVVVASGVQSSAELHALRSSVHGELVVHELLQGDHGVHRPNVRLRVNVVGTDPDAARLGEGQIELELPDTKVQQMIRKLEKAADVDELEIAVSQAAVRVRSADADVVVDPESDIAAKVAGGKNAEQTGFKISRRDKRRQRACRCQRVKPVFAGAGPLEIVVHAQANRWKAGDGSRPDGFWPRLCVGGSSQHDRRNFDHRLVVFGEFETCVLEGLAEVIEFWEIEMACGAAGAI